MDTNQCRSFGISLCDDPTDPYRPLGIQITEDMFIPFTMKGSTCGFESRCPTDTEI